MTVIATAQLGVPLTILEDFIYACPVQFSSGFCADAASVLEVSMDGSTNWLPITIGSDGAFFTSAPFIRTTDPEAVVMFKSY